MGVILDSTILIAAEKQQLNLPSFFAAHAHEPMFIAAITASELLHGVERATPPRREKRARFVENLLSSIEAIDFDVPVARCHAAIWAALETAGSPIGAHDIQIAATAVHHGHKVATLNTKDFKRVAGLRLLAMAPFIMPAPKAFG